MYIIVYANNACMQVIDFDEEFITFYDSQGGIFYETIYQQLRYIYSMMSVVKVIALYNKSHIQFLPVYNYLHGWVKGR